MTFLTDMMEKVYSQEEIFAVLFESEKDKKRRQMLAIVTKTVDAHRLQKMRDLLTFEKLATWRKMNGFDRVMYDEDIGFMLICSHQRLKNTVRVCGQICRS